MPKKTIDKKNGIKEKLEYLGLDLDSIPKELKNHKPLEYRIPKFYEEKQYKQYRYVPVKNIQILLSPTNRLDDIEEKYKKARPLEEYLDNKKAVDIKAIEVTEVTVLADYFVLATATSSTHVRALADEVEDALSQNGLEPHHVEGRTTGWILLDYGTAVVNVMDAKNRDFYGLEHTWNDGKELDISEYIKD